MHHLQLFWRRNANHWVSNVLLWSLHVVSVSLPLRETFYDQARSLRLYQNQGSNLTICKESYNGQFDFSNIDETKILCFTSPELKHVPSSCDIGVGTPIYTEVKYNKKSMMILKGLALFSKDCGPVIASKLSAYADWINQEAFNKV